jgi:hypothetical protein
MLERMERQPWNEIINEIIKPNIYKLKMED